MHFFRSWSVGELLLLKLRVIKIVTRPPYLTPLLLLYSSLCTECTLFVGRKFFAWVCQLSTTAELISRKILRSATYTFFGSWSLANCYYTKDWRVIYKQHSLLYFTRAYCCIQVYVQNARYCVGNLNFCKSMSQTIDHLIDQSQNKAVCVHRLFSFVILANCWLTKLSHIK